jgi:hypothetical protein
MSNDMKTAESSSIPAPLKQWLDNAILAQIQSPQTGADFTLSKKALIANTILYPLEEKSRKSKAL